MDHMEEMRQLLEKFNNDVQNMKKDLKINHDLFDVKKKLHVGGLDMSFSKRKGDDGESIDEVHAVVTLVVIELSVESPARSPEVVYEHSTFVHLELPYLSGYLGFREAPWYKEELELIGRENSHLFPQVLLVDGNGILHHEGFGSACHIGVALDIPTIGVAKQLLYVDGLSKDEIKGQISQLQEAGDSFSLVGHTRGIMGKALKSTKKSENPLFISVGHKIDLQSAVDIVCRCCTAYRIPEPIRQADMISRRHMREEYDKHINNCKLDEAERQERSQHLKQMQACGEEIKRNRIATQS